MSPLTVLSVAYPLAPVGRNAAGGAEQVLAALDEALVKAGHRSLVVACEGSEVAGTLVPVPNETGVLDEDARMRAWAQHRLAVTAALARWPVDLVHLHGIDFHAYAPAGIPTLVTLHLPLGWYPPGALLPHPGRHLHCVSAAQHSGAPPGMVLLPPVPNGVPLGALCVPHAKRTFCLTLGRICPEKGTHLALEASHLADRPLVVAGQVYRYPAHEAYFEAQVRPMLDARRRFVGPLGFRRKCRFLAAARCLLVPSLAPETSSLVAMEAIASGTPVIAFANGALPDTVEHGRTGFIVETATEMAEAIHAVDALDPATIRAAARERFSAERMAERYFALYDRIAAGMPLQRAS